MPDHVTRDLHVIVTADGHSLTADSPQLPGFIFGRTTETEFSADIRPTIADIYSTYFPDDLTPHYRVIFHQQFPITTPEGVEVMLRARNDPADVRQVRDEARRRLAFILMATDDDTKRVRLDLVANQLTNMVGDLVLVAVAPNDLVADVIASMDESADALILAVAVAENGVWTTQLATRSAATSGWRSLDDFGLPEGATISDVMVAEGTNRSRLVVGTAA